MKKYLLGQLSQVSAWIGFALIISAFVAPRWLLVVFGVLLVITDDAKLKAWVSRNAPWVTAKLDEWTK